MEELSRIISALVQHSFIVGFFVGHFNRDTLNISHLLSAYDTLNFCEAKHNQIRALRAILLCFKAVSSLRVKSELVPIGNVCNTQSLASILKCKLSSLHLKTWIFQWGLPQGL